tara:strand:+ start:7999 stop:8952 length:954 start_codon:yes stop_codon:yes gene_type:complete
MPTVDAIWRARESEAAERPQYEGYGISASKLGKECDRELWYDLRWVSPAEVFDGRKLRIFERGNIEEDRVIEDLKRAGLSVDEVNPNTGKQWRFALARGFLRGKADGRVSGVIEAPKTVHTLEIKSARAADWRGVLEHGLRKHKPDHWHQLHSGMAGLGDDRGLYVMVNKDTEEILTERINFEPEEVTRQEARVERLLDDHIGPMRASDDPAAFVCRFCKHKATCHDGAPARRNCRTCVFFTFTSDGNGHCERFETPKRPDSQHKGADCPAHLFLPALVDGEQVDADPERELITYRMRDGFVWTDGATETHIQESQS